MIFYPNERITLFIDGVNLYSSARSLGFDVDYRKLLQFFRSKGILVRAYYYTLLVEDQEYSHLRPLIDWLDYNGYSVVTKPAKEFVDQAGKRRFRGKMDIELVIDMVRLSETTDHLILFSGDGDFFSAIQYLQSRGKRVSVISTIRTQPPMAADELRRQADQFVELDQLRKFIEREGERLEPAPSLLPLDMDM